MQARTRPKPPSAPASPPARRVLPFALLFGALVAGAPALAGPEGGRVVSGKADIVQTSPKRLDIVQGSDKAVIDWRSFSIDIDEHTDFRQPSSSSIALNRVRGGGESLILGQLTANGRIFLINPNGILFGASARVDVGGLLATTIDIEDDDFLTGRFDFDIPGSPGGTVVNRGEITAAEGGLAALVAPGVENSGVIRARLGRVALASGNAFTLDLHGDNLIRIGIDDRVAARLIAADGAELEALVSNSGTIEADGGTVVLLAAGAGRDVVDYAINMDGIVRARTAEKRNGRIVLRGAGDGTVRVAGTLDASGRGSGETGGKVKVLGEKVGIVGEARLDASGDAGAGEVLMGGNFQGKGPERNADYTAVGPGAFIRADTLSRGDGGRVIVWSNRVTRFFGGISARGGSASGDGGFAEVSGKLHLQFAPVSIDLSAPNGAAGDLLLDPRDIVISDGDGANDSQVSADNKINFGDGPQNRNWKIKPSAFETIDADITLQAWRDITVSSDIDRSGSGNRTLSLQAGRHLTISADITGTNGAHSFIFEADSPQSTTGGGDGTGTLTIGNGVTITSNGGDITLIGADFSIDTTSGSEANPRPATWGRRGSS
ncbi:MAG: filamentous hemagglutinin N-terminal domain-containing protein [Alphaproteobacteria bacterium]|nr:filamentous hemagglutinin N-terminal domain-containing protein [Alphaproteobacteria bacterium]